MQLRKRAHDLLDQGGLTHHTFGNEHWDSRFYVLIAKDFSSVHRVRVWVFISREENSDLHHNALVHAPDPGPGISNGQIGQLDWLDEDGNIVGSLSGLKVDFQTYLDATDNDTTTIDDRYVYMVSLFSGNVTVNGSAGDDRGLELGEGGTATVNGKAGDDRLNVWHQKTIKFDGGAGNDTIAFDYAHGFQPQPANGATVDLTARTGTNPFGGAITLVNVENVVGQFGASNNLRGNALSNILQGGIAADTLRGEGGNDQIGVKYHTTLAARATKADGGAGTDTLVAELSYSDAAPFTGSGQTLQIINRLDLLTPSQNTGTFHGGTFTNFEIIRVLGDLFQVFDFRGANTSETVSGASGKDLLSGRSGHDVLNGQGGNDTMNGGLGNDTFHADSRFDKAIEAVGQGADRVISTATFTLGANVENLTLDGFAAINGTGNALNNTMTGNGAANRLNGVAGNDSLSGDAGNDIINGGTGIDTMKGGLGNDTFYADSSLDKAIELGSQGIDRVISTATFTLAANVEHLLLSGVAAINGTGNALANTITGNGKNNTLTGLGANDILIGGIGNDILIGGVGKDTMTGGSGTDDFDFNAVGETGKTAATRDVITDFTRRRRHRSVHHRRQRRRGGPRLQLPRHQGRGLHRRGGTAALVPVGQHDDRGRHRQRRQGRRFPDSTDGVKDADRGGFRAVERGLPSTGQLLLLAPQRRFVAVIRPELGVKPTCRGHRQSDAIDPVGR